MLVIIFSLFYVVSCYLSFLSNKIAYKKAKVSIKPIAWFIPVVNTLSVPLLLLIVIVEICILKGFFTSDFWAKRWDS